MQGKAKSQSLDHSETSVCRAESYAETVVRAEVKTVTGNHERGKFMVNGDSTFRHLVVKLEQPLDGEYDTHVAIEPGDLVGDDGSQMYPIRIVLKTPDSLAALVAVFQQLMADPTGARVLAEIGKPKALPTPQSA